MMVNDPGVLPQQNLDRSAGGVGEKVTEAEAEPCAHKTQKQSHTGKKKVCEHCYIRQHKSKLVIFRHPVWMCTGCGGLTAS